MQNNTRIGIEIQSINNGYLVTGHKNNGYQGADTGKNFYSTFDEMATELVGIVRQSFDLNLEPEEDPFAAAYGGNTLMGGIQ